MICGDPNELEPTRPCTSTTSREREGGGERAAPRHTHTHLDERLDARGGREREAGAGVGGASGARGGTGTGTGLQQVKGLQQPKRSRFMEIFDRLRLRKKIGRWPPRERKGETAIAREGGRE